jgi:glycosyltransferase involved in cell wall biosynthesis
VHEAEAKVVGLPGVPTAVGVGAGAGSPPQLHAVFVKSILTAFGGAEHTAVRLACGLRRQGHRVSFLTRPPLDREHPYFRELVAAGVDVHVFPHIQDSRLLVALSRLVRPLLLPAYLLYRPKPLRQAWDALGSILWTLRAKLERAWLERRLTRIGSPRLPTVANVFGPEGLLPWVAAWGRRRSVPVVYTETVEADRKAVQTFDLRWTVEAIHQVPLVVCCGPRVARNIRENYGYRGEIAEIPFLVDDPRPLPGRTRARPAVVLGIVGRVVEHKGHRDVLWALDRLRRTGLDVELVVAGDGPLRGELQRLTDSLALTRFVRFTGRFDQIADVMESIDIFTLPSTSEAQPLAISEAMAYGKPVVASDFGGIPDMLEDGKSGLMVPTGDREALVEALRRLVSDGELRASMGARGQQLFLENRSSRVVLEKITQAYARLLGGSAA